MAVENYPALSDKKPPLTCSVQLQRFFKVHRFGSLERPMIWKWAETQLIDSEFGQTCVACSPCSRAVIRML